MMATECGTAGPAVQRARELLAEIKAEEQAVKDSGYTLQTDYPRQCGALQTALELVLAEIGAAP